MLFSTWSSTLIPFSVVFCSCLEDDLPSALGCLVDGKVYVVVTRGEKPTAGYDIQIDKMKLEKTEQGKNLVVTALFTDPPAGETVAQVITYPYQVAETDLTELPDTIELRTIFQ